MVEIVGRERQRESWTGASSKAAVGHAADANGAAERLNAVGLVGMGGGQQYRAVVEAAYNGWWLEAALKWLWFEAALQWLWLEAVVTSGCGGRQWWQVVVVGDSAKRRLCGDQLCVWVLGRPWLQGHKI